MPQTSNTEEAEVEWFYEDLQDLLELTPQKDVLFIIGDWNVKEPLYQNLSTACSAPVSSFISTYQLLD